MRYGRPSAKALMIPTNEAQRPPDAQAKGNREEDLPGFHYFWVPLDSKRSLPPPEIPVTL